MEKLQKAIQDIPTSDKICVKFDDGTVIKSLSYAEVKHFTSVICAALDKIQEKTVVHFEFDLNKHEAVFAVPAILAVALTTSCSFCINDTNEPETAKESTLLLSLYGYTLEIKLKKAASQCPKDILYFVTTSGTISSSRKVVGVPHSSIWPNVHDFIRVFNLSEKDVIFCAAPPTFDPFYLDVFFAFLSNSCLLLTSQHVKSIGGERLFKILERNHASFSQMTPSLYKNLRQVPKSMTKLVLGGEPFPKTEAQKVPGVELYNIYGLTEMSVWQSMARVTCFEDTEQPIVDCNNLLSETQLSLRDSISGALITQNGIYGEIWVESSSRMCYFDDQVHSIVKTKDRGILKNGNLFCAGRMDDVFKIHGRRMSMREVEEVWSQYFNAPSYGVLDSQMFLNAYIRSSESLEVLEQRASTTLPPYLRPFRAVICDQELPRNENGKIDRKALKALLLKANRSGDISDLRLLWKQFCGHFPDENSSFISEGGDSYSAVLLSESLGQKDNLQDSQVTELFHIILTKTFNDLCVFYENIKSSPLAANHPLQVPSKIAKMDSHATTNSIKQLWSKYMGKCIDASPILVGDSVVIGSHKGLFAAFDLLSGEELWKLQLDDRIEATATSSENELQVFIGTYRGTFYSVNSKSGAILWKNTDAQDLIKCKATVSRNRVLFGSHDQNLRCLSVEDGSLLWKCDLGGAILASAIAISPSHVFCATLKGTCFKLEISTGEVLASTSLDSPVFSSPKLANSNIIVASVRGTVFCLDMNLTKIWTFKCEGHIFAPVCITKDLCLIAAQSCLITAIDFSGKEKWTFGVKNPVTAACCPINEDTAVMVVDNSSAVSIIDTAAGRAIHEFSLDIGQTFSAPMIKVNLMAIGSRNDQLYCFEF